MQNHQALQKKSAELVAEMKVAQDLTNAESSGSTSKSAELAAEMQVAQDLTNAESSGSTKKSAELAAEIQVAQITARSEQIAEDSIHDSAYVMVEGAQEDVHEHI